MVLDLISLATLTQAQDEPFTETKKRLEKRTGFKGKNFEKIKFAIVKQRSYSKPVYLADGKSSEFYGTEQLLIIYRCCLIRPDIRRGHAWFRPRGSTTLDAKRRWGPVLEVDFSKTGLLAFDTLCSEMNFCMLWYGMGFHQRRFWW